MSELRVIGGRAMAKGAYEAQGKKDAAYTAGPLEYVVGKGGIKGNLHKAGVAAKLSPDTVIVEYCGRRHVLGGEGVIRTLMAISSELTDDRIRGENDNVVVSVSATGPTAQETLDEFCYRAFTPADKQEEECSKRQKMDA
jgi:hypothetical protein